MKLVSRCRKLSACTALLAGLGILTATPSVMAQDAPKILKSMSDFMASQKSISLAFDSDIEVVTPLMEKIQFTNSGTLAMTRPDKLRATRTGGYADMELVFDGKTLSVLGKHLNVYAQAEMPGSIDHVIDRMRNDFEVAIPGADLLLTQSFEELMAEVIEAKHIGIGVIDGVECEHLAFRGRDTDWQLWVRAGAQPVPCKYVITSKTLAGAPQYTLRIRNWKSDTTASGEAVSFNAPAGAKKLDFSQLQGMDEVPPSAPMGGR